ncbi:MAG: haloacid dehalogenase type II [Pseudomonadota bacterium]
MPIQACVFDAYGTLFDVAAAARAASAEPDFPALADAWPRLAAHWRQKQLEYTWLRAVRGDHTDFWEVTKDGLDWAMEAEGLNDPALRDRLLALYRELEAYPEVPEMLARLKADGRRTAILSNGSPGMLEDAIASAGIGAQLDAVLSVEEVGVFKPDPSVYDLVGRHLGTDRGEVLFASSNGWDAASAARYGFVTVWVNRAGAPAERLPAPSDHMLADLTKIPALVDRL